MFKRATHIKTASVSLTECSSFHQPVFGQDRTPRWHASPIYEGLVILDSSARRSAAGGYKHGVSVPLHLSTRVIGFSSRWVIHYWMCLVIFHVSFFAALVGNSSLWWAVQTIWEEPFDCDALWMLWRMHTFVKLFDIFAICLCSVGECVWWSILFMKSIARGYCGLTYGQPTLHFSYRTCSKYKQSTFFLNSLSMVISTLLWALGVEQSDLLPLGCLKYLDSYLKINFDLGVVVTHQKIKINIMERLGMSPPFPRELCVCLYIIHVGFLFGSLSRRWAKNIGFVQFSGCSVAIVLRKPYSGGEFISGIAEILFLMLTIWA